MNYNYYQVWYSESSDKIVLMHPKGGYFIRLEFDEQNYLDVPGFASLDYLMQKNKFVWLGFFNADRLETLEKNN